jgi:hypothetical protein
LGYPPSSHYSWRKLISCCDWNISARFIPQEKSSKTLIGKSSQGIELD